MVDQRLDQKLLCYSNPNISNKSAVCLAETKLYYYLTEQEGSALCRSLAMAPLTHPNRQLFVYFLNGFWLAKWREHFGGKNCNQTNKANQQSVFIGCLWSLFWQLN